MTTFEERLKRRMNVYTPAYRHAYFIHFSEQISLNARDIEEAKSDAERLLMLDSALKELKEKLCREIDQFSAEMRRP